MRVLRNILRGFTGPGRKEITELMRRELPRVRLSTPTPAQRALVDQFLGRLPDCDRQMLEAWQRGRTSREIAQDMGLDVEPVRQSLARIMADLRMWLYGSGPRDPSPEDAPVPMVRTA